jgi:hypothetical protein
VSGRMAWRPAAVARPRPGQGIDELDELGKGFTEGDRDATAAEPPGPDDGAR